MLAKFFSSNSNLFTAVFTTKEDMKNLETNKDFFINLEIYLGVEFPDNVKLILIQLFYIENEGKLRDLSSIFSDLSCKNPSQITDHLVEAKKQIHNISGGEHGDVHSKQVDDYLILSEHIVSFLIYRAARGLNGRTLHRQFFNELRCFDLSFHQAQQIVQPLFRILFGDKNAILQLIKALSKCTPSLILKTQVIQHMNTVQANQSKIAYAELVATIINLSALACLPLPLSEVLPEEKEVKEEEEEAQRASACSTTTTTAAATQAVSTITTESVQSMLAEVKKLNRLTSARNATDSDYTTKKTASSTVKMRKTSYQQSIVEWTINDFNNFVLENIASILDKVIKRSPPHSIKQEETAVPRQEEDYSVMRNVIEILSGEIQRLHAKIEDIEAKSANTKAKGAEAKKIADIKKIILSKLQFCVNAKDLAQKSSTTPDILFKFMSDVYNGNLLQQPEDIHGARYAWFTSVNPTKSSVEKCLQLLTFKPPSNSEDQRQQPATQDATSSTGTHLPQCLDFGGRM